MGLWSTSAKTFGPGKIGFFISFTSTHLIRMSCHNRVTRETTAPRFNLRFGFDRLSWRQRHRAVEEINLDVIWPAGAVPFKGHIALNAPLEEILDKVDLRMKSDASQLAFIERGLSPKEAAPQLLFGGFGTGKTDTLVQLVKTLCIHSACKILVCAYVNKYDSPVSSFSHPGS